MRVVITERSPDGDETKDEFVIIRIDDDEDIDVEVIEADEDHWANRWTAKDTNVRSIRRRLTLRNGDVV